MQARPGWLATWWPKSARASPPRGVVSRVFNRVQSQPSHDIIIALIGRYTRESGSSTPVN
jgi:hypothetical protein